MIRKSNFDLKGLFFTIELVAVVVVSRSSYAEELEHYRMYDTRRRTTLSPKQEYYRTKRLYLRFYPSQLDGLEALYILNNYPSRQQKEETCKMLNVERDRLEVWFKNRRIKQKHFERRGLFPFDERQRRIRYDYEKWQTYELDKYFRNVNHYPDHDEMKALASKLKITGNHLRLDNWFKMRRTKEREKTGLDTKGVTYYYTYKGTRFKLLSGREFLPIEKIKMLEGFFEKNPYPNASEKIKICKKLNMTSLKKVNTWFTAQRNRSARIGNMSLKFPQKSRYRFSRHQRELLEEEFQKNIYPGIKERKELCRKVGINRSVLKNWFLRRRKVARETGPYAPGYGVIDLDKA